MNQEAKMFFAEHWPSVLESMKMYIKETKTCCLNLKDTGLETEQLESVLTLLQGSQVTELDLSENSFTSGMENLSALFAGTKLKKVNISSCCLSNENLLHLMEVLKDTQISDLDLSLNDVSLNDRTVVRKFVYFLLKSHLTVLNMRFTYYGGNLLIVQVLPYTSITHLNLSACNLSSVGLSCLFSILPATPIIDLNLSDNEISFKKLISDGDGFRLRGSKLEKLDLSMNGLKDTGANLVLASLSHSKLISLNLALNGISGTNDMSKYLQDTKIENLDLSGNRMKENRMFLSPDFFIRSSISVLDIGFCKLGDELCQKIFQNLKASSITKLNLSANDLQIASISQFAQIVKDTIIEDVNFSYNHLSPEAIVVLGSCLKESRIKHINLNYCFEQPTGSDALSAFIKKTIDTSLESLKMSRNHINGNGAAIIAASLPGTMFSHLDLSYNEIGDGAVYLAAQIKFTTITHLNLCGNNVKDEGAKVLAKCLKESQIIELNLNSNSITGCGAKALAFSLKQSSLLSLHLEHNKITNDGFEALAEEAEHTFFNSFKGKGNVGKTNILIDKVLWKNKISARKLVDFFKQIAPEVNGGNMCFDCNLDDTDVSTFLEECAHFYKTVINQPAAISVLAQENSLPFSRREVATLLLEDFPQQFILLLEKKIELNFTKFIKFLNKYDELGLSEILKPLLTNAPKLKINENLLITHPAFYKLSLKYELPICNVVMHSENKIRVIKYLSENPDIDGALGMIGILCDELLDRNSSC